MPIERAHLQNGSVGESTTCNAVNATLPARLRQNRSTARILLKPCLLGSYAIVLYKSGKGILAILSWNLHFEIPSSRST